MAKTYSPQVRKRARELYMAGLAFEELARSMRTEGYTYLNAETVRRWADKGGWKEAREKLQAEEGRAALALDAERVLAEMLESYDQARGELLKKMADGQMEYADGLQLLLKVDGLRRNLLAQASKGTVGRVDKVALAAEVLTLVVETLAEEDPASMEYVHPHIPKIGQLLKERYAEVA